MRDHVCAPFCRYHKPGKREEPGCAGLVWLQSRPHLRGEVSRLGPDPSRPLFGLNDDDPRLLHVCERCDYRLDGCDFRDPAVPRYSCSPCGGLRTVAGLLAAGCDLGL